MENNIENICVFCGSSEDLVQEYYSTANKLGELIVENNYGLIHGGGIIGLMGALTKGAASKNGKIIGVVPEFLNRPNIANSNNQELVITKDMKERKEFMRQNACAFIALPGGFGTLEEVAEVITLKQLKYHSKQIIFINTLNYYDKLLDFFEELYDQNFANLNYKKLYKIVNTPEQAIEQIKNYQFENIYDKYLGFGNVR
ncbi:MAG: TIGR00730 family Rossman fold protein [Bacteroidales bacterium]|jgi:uncharacterized protein (TIGR00730 family)|nr:TIGR00730 family Rossman fold protein [Bacteroidales bacterium]